jgi:hypothetical protein
VGIIRAFEREAIARGASPVVVIIPLVPDLRTLKREGTPVYAPLLEELERSGTRYLDLGEQLGRTLGDDDPCTLYSKCGGGHFTKAAYRAVARLVYEFLRDRSLLPCHSRRCEPGEARRAR